MGTLNEKLEYLSQTKEYIKEAIISKGQPVSSSDTFRSYASKIAAIENGDVITATNTTGSTVSVDDRVWVETVRIGTRHFNVYGNPTIDDSTGVVKLNSTTDYINVTNLSGINPTTSLEIVVKIKKEVLSASGAGGETFFATFAQSSSNASSTINTRFSIWDNKFSNYYGWYSPEGSGAGANNIATNEWVWLKYKVENGTRISSYSFDGESWTTATSGSAAAIANYNFTSYPVIVFGINTSAGTLSSSNVEFDLSETYIKVDGEYYWQPYSFTDAYSIIPSADITSTSFTGIAQANIANNATGSVKTLLDGNGTYAPTTATKTITTNGTYTASAENAYGLSEVTVNVPTPDVWHNWKTDVTASLNNYSDPRGYNWCDIAYGNNKFIAVGNMDSATSYLIESTDGQTWAAKDVLWSKQWRGIASDGTVFVTVSYGDNTVNYTNTSGTWYSSTMPSSGNWRSVAYGNGKFVAIKCTDNDISGTYAYSSDGGVTWTERTLPYSNQGLSRIRWCNDRFIIICSSQNNPSNRYFYSTDGENWSTGYFSTPTTYWKDVAYGDGKYLAIADSSGRYAVSTDGVNWTEGTVVSGTTHFYSIAYCNGYFVACQSNTKDKYYTPASSISWTKLESGYSTRCIAANESFFAIPSYGWGYVSKLQIGQSQCYTLTASPTTSTQVYEIPKKTSEFTITAVGTGTITLSDSKVYNRNSAGDVESPVLGTKTITSNNTYTAASDYLDGYSSVTVDVEDIPAVVESLSITPTTSAQSFTPTGGVDGYSPVTVSAVTSSIDANIVEENIKSGVSILGVTGSLVESNNTTVSLTPTTSAQTITPTSPYNGFDEINVSAVTAAIDPDITPENIVEGVNILGVTGTAEITTLDVTTPRLVVVNNGTDGVAYSDDGGNIWSESEMPVTAEWRKIAYGDGRYVAVAEGSSSTVGAYSDNGISWTQITMPSGNWYDICYGAGKFVAINRNSNIMAYSADGITWTSITLLHSDYWNSITYGNGAFVIVGKSYYAYSEDGVTWTEDDLPINNVTAYTKAGDNISVTILQNYLAFAYSEDITQGFTAGMLPSGLNKNWYNLCYGNGTFLATVLGGEETEYITMISSDGINWARTATTTAFLGEPNDHAYDLKTVVYDPSIQKFVGLTRNGQYTFTAGSNGIWTVTENDPVLIGNSWNGMCYGEPVTGTTTVDDMLNEINGENIDNYNELDDALDELNGESA